MLVGIVDTETTGLDTKEDYVIEIGGIKVDTETWDEVEQFSALIKNKGNPEISKLITEITGITNEDIDRSGVDMSVAYYDFCMVFADVKYFIAHNKNFDKEMMVNNFKRYNLDPSLLTNKEWICSAADIPHEGKKCWTLSHMALDYGVSVDPGTLHRAVDDVRLLKQMLEARGVPFEKDVEHYKKPDVKFVAKIKPPWEDGGVQKNQAMKLGFRFDGNNKTWAAVFKEGHQFPEVPFEIVEVDL